MLGHIGINVPDLVRTGQTLAGDLPADLLGPVETVKDWELVSPGHWPRR